LPWVATGCRGVALVRRESAVRFRQRLATAEGPPKPAELEHFIR
jgi:hypothetical protein